MSESWILRLLIYVPVLYLVMVVYVGQRQDNAVDTLRLAVRPALKGVVYTVILVLVMQALQWLFID